MEFVCLKEVDEKVIKEYMDLVNKVIDKVHSIGFTKKLDRESAEKFLKDKISKKNSALLLVYENGLIGTGYLGPTGYETTKHYGEISKVMVDPDAQGRGIGKKIMLELEEKAKELGYSNILLDTWDIEHIRRFYEKIGYEQVGKIPDFIKHQGKFHDSYFYVKKI